MVFNNYLLYQSDYWFFVFNNRLGWHKGISKRRGCECKERWPVKPKWPGTCLKFSCLLTFCIFRAIFMTCCGLLYHLAVLATCSPRLFLTRSLWELSSNFSFLLFYTSSFVFHQVSGFINHYLLIESLFLTAETESQNLTD